MAEMSAEKPVLSGVSIEDDMDDDFDDLLDQFNHTPPPAQPEQPVPAKPTEATSASTAGDSEWPKEVSDEFARDLAEGMEALLAGMKDEDGGEFKKHLEALVADEGNELSGVNDLLDALGQRGQAIPSGSTEAEPKIEMKNFQDAIKDTMDKLKQSDDSAKAKSGPSGSGGEDEQLAALFEKIMAGDGELPDENELQTMLQSFMAELMSKEIMYEPLKDMDRLYPGWIATNRSKLSPEDLGRYQTQSDIVSQVVQKFEHPSWDAEEKSGGEKFAVRQKEVIDLLTKMQDCGPPPKEILGDMPPGMLGADGLPNPEQCTIS